jgi:ferredoxin
MLRQIIKIDREKCNGCGLCISACHEGAIGMEDGKAILLRDDYCDGLGNCLPVCPTGAITLDKREAVGYNDTEVKKNIEKNETLACGCPGTNAKAFKREEPSQQVEVPSPHAVTPQASVSQLNQWPVQIKLVPVNAPYFENANLLVSADCAAYAYGSFHNDFMKDKITLIGCPKLDEGDYSKKLAAILRSNSIKSVSTVRMEVPCCSGIENAVKTALKDCGKMIPWQVIIFSTEGYVTG